MGLFDLFELFVDRPWLALVPALVFLVAAKLLKLRSLWAAAAACATYFLYELGVQARVLCSGECNIRVDLLLIAPILLLLSVLAPIYLVLTLVRVRAE